MRPDKGQSLGKARHEASVLGQGTINLLHADPSQGVGAGLGGAGLQIIPLGIVGRYIFSRLGQTGTIPAPQSAKQGQTLGLMPRRQGVLDGGDDELWLAV